jgi:hypothetical protein
VNNKCIYDQLCKRFLIPSIPCYAMLPVYHEMNLRQSMATKKARQTNNARSSQGDGGSGRMTGLCGCCLADGVLSDTLTAGTGSGAATDGCTTGGPTGVPQCQQIVKLGT